MHIFTHLAPQYNAGAHVCSSSNQLGIITVLQRITCHTSRAKHGIPQTTRITRHTLHLQGQQRLMFPLHQVSHQMHTTRQTECTSHKFHVTRHTSHVTRHTSHVARHTSHVTRHTCIILLKLSNIMSLCFWVLTCIAHHITSHTSHVTRHTSHLPYVTRHTSHVTNHTTSRVTGDKQYITRRKPHHTPQAASHAASRMPPAALAPPRSLSVRLFSPAALVSRT